MPDAPSLLTGGQWRGFPRADEPSGQFNGLAAAREGTVATETPPLATGSDVEGRSRESTQHSHWDLRRTYHAL